MPVEILPKETSCKVKLVGGVEVELNFRPFTLRDLAWTLDEFDTEEKKLEIMQLKPNAICRIIWRMLKPESKELFKEIVFQDYDDDKEESYTVKVTGWEKLLHSLASYEEMINAFSTYAQSENANGFFDVGAKKKVKN